MAGKKAGKRSTPDGNKRAAAKKAGGRTLITSKSDLPAGYRELLEDLKTRVRAAQLKAAVAVHRELIQLYWDIGRMIVQRQDEEGWGKSVVERLGADIQRAFPGIQGFSPVNVWRMRAFFLAYADTDAILSQPVTELPKKRKKKMSQAVTDPLCRPPDFIADLPWGHNQVLLFKLKEPAERLWYAAKAVENGWSRAVLTVQIETDLYGRQGKAVTNFSATLPAPQSDLAQQTLKDPYVFDFLTIGEQAHERELEGGLVDHVQKFLLELEPGSPLSAARFM
jgi:predicted nuclease of restriction endonuclease-like (RecB) superfamily